MTTEEALTQLGSQTAQAIVGVLEMFAPGVATHGAPTIGADTAAALSDAPTPGLAASVAYVDGVTGGNIFLIGHEGAKRLAATMMGASPDDVDVDEPLSELEHSAVGEAMNQMIAAAAAAASTVLGYEVEIGPPEILLTGSEDLAARFEGTAHAISTAFHICERPCRLVQLVPQTFVPPSGTTSLLPPLMAPLAPYREQMLILSGVDNQVYLKGIVDNHNEGMTTLLTGWQAGDLQLPAPQRIIQQANGISLDQYVADAIGGGTVMPSLPIGYEWYHWLYDKNRNGIQHQGSPAALFTALFGDPDIDPAAQGKLVKRRKSILDEVASDYEKLLPKVSGADRIKLEEHLESIRALEMGLGNTTSCKPDMPMYLPDYPQPQIDPTGLPLWVEHMTDLLALSLACDATRVSTFFIRHGGGGQSFFPWLGMDIIP